MIYALKCLKCGSMQIEPTKEVKCPNCGGVLVVTNTAKEKK